MGYELGMISEERYARFNEKRQQIDVEKYRQVNRIYIVLKNERTYASDY
ncbi:hypothetical protein ACVNPZ_03225 [Staphylococcus aureus]